MVGRGSVTQCLEDRCRRAGLVAACRSGVDLLFGELVQEPGAAVFDGLLLEEYFAEGFHDGVFPPPCGRTMH
ncbi:hypothetical protein GCM10023086_75370 [Streptomyces venetus]|uniref:Uncharacterized protein n=1 Tax=Streptomyces venetus TaxID=1701086 RepID=A0ABP8HJ17_9ACTN